MIFTLLFIPTGIFADEDFLFITDFGEVGFRDGAIYRMDISSKRMERLNITGILWDPISIVKLKNFLFVADRQNIWKVNLNSMSTTQHIISSKFPRKVKFLGDMAKFKNKVFVSDIYGNAIYKFNLSGEIKLLFELKRPNGIAVDSTGNIFLITFTSPANVFMWNGDTLVKLFTSKFIRSGYDIEYYEGKLYMTGFLSNNVVMYDLKTNDEREIYRFDEHPAGLEILNDKIFVSFPDGGKVKVLSLEK